jgi:hypothetical protein
MYIVAGQFAQTQASMTGGKADSSTSAGQIDEEQCPSRYA